MTRCAFVVNLVLRMMRRQYSVLYIEVALCDPSALFHSDNVKNIFSASTQDV